MPHGPSTFWPVASRASSCPPSCCACSRRKRPACPSGCSTKATTRWATLPRPSRCCCPHRPKNMTSASRPGSSSTCCRCARPRSARPPNWRTGCAPSGGSSRPRSGWCTSSSSRARSASACRSCRSRRRSLRSAGSMPSASRSGSWATRTSAHVRRRATTRRWSRQSPMPSRCARPADSPIPSSSRIRSTSRSTSSTSCWARRPTGSSNGSGTASARRSSSGRVRCGCGRAAKSW
ncbi:hypothetical protein D9M68_684120 [compost metagenome]